MEKSKSQRIEEFPLPEAMIHHIQSFMSGKEAARTTILSKSWYNAWLTRPDLHFNQHLFQNLHPFFFEEFAAKTIQRYKSSKLKIHSFTLLSHPLVRFSGGIQKLILDAMEIGATHLNLHLSDSSYTLPQELLRSKTLIKLSLIYCRIDQTLNCPMLKSLTLERVHLAKHNIITCDKLVSIEELSLSDFSIFDNNALNGMNTNQLRKLKRLHLMEINVDNSFFDNFDSRFPCLKDLSLVHCRDYQVINIASASLASVSIVQKQALRGRFVVPNLARFSYSGPSITSLTVKAAAAAREWECYISIQCHRSHNPRWYLRLHKLLKRLRTSRINLSLKFDIGMSWRRIGEDDRSYDDQVLLSLQSVVVENVTIEAPFDLGWKLLVGLFWICSPRFVTHYWLPRGSSCWMENNRSLHNLYHRLSQTVADANAEDNILRTGLGIKEVNVEVYEEILTVWQWRPLVLEEPLDALVAPPNKRKVLFGLKWW